MSASLRIRPIDVALVEGLALCSVRVLMRRVRSALRRASIGGCQVTATQTAEHARNVLEPTPPCSHAQLRHNNLNAEPNKIFMRCSLTKKMAGRSAVTA